MELLRRERWTGVRIAQATGLSRATVSRILVRLKLNKVKMLEPQVPIVRYEHPLPGDLLHVDIKKLAQIKSPGKRLTGNPQDETRGAGWEFLYVTVDDHSRMAYVAMMPDEKAASSSRFLREAAAYFARHNISPSGLDVNNLLRHHIYSLQLGDGAASHFSSEWLENFIDSDQRWPNHEAGGFPCQQGQENCRAVSRFGKPCEAT